ncbi:MAG: DUF1592 domain-containing protein, partial [Verrucomicrobiota bacterium]
GEQIVGPYFDIYRRARSLGADFTDAMVAGFASILCSPDYLYLENHVGLLGDRELASRLSYFLWNGPPDNSLKESKPLSNAKVRRAEAERMLKDERSERFLDAFLDYWLELREINANAPDAELYPDYYLDDLLTESSLRETRRFFRELVDEDLPVSYLVDSDFTFLNERLADHYALPRFEGVGLEKVYLPEGSVRGGLLTQASVLRVTANGTTTSPVMRGVWVAERILGVEVHDPPSGIEAIEPDTRGATSIREQLDKHREVESCNACHAKFDPFGFALESFDVAGGWQEQYRAVNEVASPETGFGKNGHAFVYHLAQQVECEGELDDGRAFSGIQELKTLLISDPRALARNLVNRIVVYATGAPVSFSDREEVERILDACEEGDFGLRSLILEVVQSRLFAIK